MTLEELYKSHTSMYRHIYRFEKTPELFAIVQKQIKEELKKMTKQHQELLKQERYMQKNCQIVKKKKQIYYKIEDIGQFKKEEYDLLCQKIEQKKEEVEEQMSNISDFDVTIQLAKENHRRDMKDILVMILCFLQWREKHPQEIEIPEENNVEFLANVKEQPPLEDVEAFIDQKLGKIKQKLMPKSK